MAHLIIHCCLLWLSLCLSPGVNAFGLAKKGGMPRRPWDLCQDSNCLYKKDGTGVAELLLRRGAHACSGSEGLRKGCSHILWRAKRPLDWDLKGSDRNYSSSRHISGASSCGSGYGRRRGLSPRDSACSSAKRRSTGSGSASVGVQSSDQSVRPRSSRRALLRSQVIRASSRGSGAGSGCNDASVREYSRGSGAGSGRNDESTRKYSRGSGAGSGRSDEDFPRQPVGRGKGSGRNRAGDGGSSRRGGGSSSKDTNKPSLTRARDR